MTAALIHHQWIGFFQYTLFNGQGQWTPNEGDQVTEVALQRSLNGMNFEVVPNGLGLVDENNIWSAGGWSLHDGQAYHLRGRIKFSYNGGSGEVWSDHSTALSCEP